MGGTNFCLDFFVNLVYGHSMSNDNNSIINQNEHAIVLPAFNKSPKLHLDMGTIREAEMRLIEAKTVSPVTYAELSHCYNESYRVLKQHLSNLGYQLLMAEKALEEAKADVILGEYAEYLKDKPKSAGNSELRNAFLIRNPAYNTCLDRIAQIKALQSNFEGKIKVLENVVSYMKQKMYLISKSGLGNENLYLTDIKKGK
jgi:hypothetical protein